MNCQPSIVVFEYNQRELCLDLEKVQAILTYEEYAELSGTRFRAEKSFIFYNREVHLLQEGISCPQNNMTGSGRLIIIEVNGMLLGLWADLIKEIRILGEGENIREMEFSF
ncbi:MAG: hypothetical protein ACM3U0_02215 [archaeon]